MTTDNSSSRLVRGVGAKDDWSARIAVFDTVRGGASAQGRLETAADGPQGRPLRGEGRGLMSQSGQEETADVAPGAAQSPVNISSSSQGAGLLGRDCHGARVHWSPR